MRIFYFLLFFSATIFNSCSNGKSDSNKTTLSAAEFSEKVNKQPTPQLIDVRTPDEFSKGHLINANNIDWNASDFDEHTSKLNKSQPVYVYCLSGKRSAAAADHMRSNGFKEVYELNGGIMKWRGANLPETTENKTMSNGMTKVQFDELLNSNKLVLVDFYADWCAPCKKMKPYLDEISKDMSENVLVIRINADDNQELCKELKIDELPVLHLYKNKAMEWTNKGFIEKADVLKEIEKLK